MRVGKKKHVSCFIRVGKACFTFQTPRNIHTYSHFSKSATTNAKVQSFIVIMSHYFANEIRERKLEEEREREAQRIAEIEASQPTIDLEDPDDYESFVDPDEQAILSFIRRDQEEKRLEWERQKAERAREEEKRACEEAERQARAAARQEAERQAQEDAARRAAEIARTKEEQQLAQQMKCRQNGMIAAGVVFLLAIIIAIVAIVVITGSGSSTPSSDNEEITRTPSTGSGNEVIPPGTTPVASPNTVPTHATTVAPVNTAIPSSNTEAVQQQQQQQQQQQFAVACNF